MGFDYKVFSEQLKPTHKLDDKIISERISEAFEVKERRGECKCISPLCVWKGAKFGVLYLCLLGFGVSSCLMYPL